MQHAAGAVVGAAEAAFTEAAPFEKNPFAAAGVPGTVVSPVAAVHPKTAGPETPPVAP